ncbi:hypothetical protein R6Q57_025704 [Mikania cordata]
MPILVPCSSSIVNSPVPNVNASLIIDYDVIPAMHNGTCKYSRFLLSALLDYTASHRQGLWKYFECWRGTKKGNHTITKWCPNLPTSRAKTKHVIPASFSLQLKRGDSDSLFNHHRKLLNTEKLIFKNDDTDLRNQSITYVILTVEPEGVVAIPNLKEREMVIYNIVCDELMLGIPFDAWWVVILAVVCLGVAFAVPFFLPSVVANTYKTEGQGATFKNS